MSDFLTLHTALSGILSARAGVETASHNVANAQSEGYTRQRVEQRSRTTNHEAAYGSVGTGADIEGITRARDRFLDMRLRSGLSTMAGLEAKTALLTRVEDAMSEPEMGVGAALSATWSSFEELALDPSDPAARRNVLANLENLTARIRTIAADWERVGEDALGSIEHSANEVNQLLEEVAELNDSIRRSSSLSPPNDLYDRRDVALDRLAELVGAESVEAENGTVRVSVNGVGLVDGGEARSLVTDTATGDLIHPSGVALPVGGEVGAVQNFLRNDLPAREQDLADFVDVLVTNLNSRHADGWSSETDPGGDLLTPGATPATLTVALTDPDGLATSSIAGPPFPVHNGDNAQWLADLRDDAVSGSRSLGQVWRELVTDIGVSVQTASNATAAQEGMTSAARLAREGAHGVSVDEEMVSLVQFQHAYSASARVMTAVDEMLEVLVTRTGIVGR